MANSEFTMGAGARHPRLREGEKKSPPFRSKRFFQMNGGWYIALRGGAIKGPYTSQLHAEEMMKSVLSMRVSQNWDTHSL